MYFAGFVCWSLFAFALSMVTGVQTSRQPCVRCYAAPGILFVHACKHDSLLARAENLRGAIPATHHHSGMLVNVAFLAIVTTVPCVQVVAKGLQGRTVTLKLKEVTFTVRQRSVTLPRHVSCAEDITRAALGLLAREMTTVPPMKLRLMGVRLSHLRLSSARPIGIADITRFMCKPTALGDREASIVVGNRGLAPPISNLMSQTKLAVDRSDSSGQAPPSVAVADANPTPNCPICGTELDSDDNALVNLHIDLCLNESTVRDVVAATRHQWPERNPAGAFPNMPTCMDDCGAAMVTDGRRLPTKRKQQQQQQQQQQHQSRRQHGPLDAFLGNPAGGSVPVKASRRPRL